MVLQDYGLKSYFILMDPLKSGGLETVTQLYLTGRGERSYFDARAMYFYGLSAADVQSQIPIIHPVIDYRNKPAQPVFGGEFSYRANLISLSRDNADFEPITQTAFNTGQCDALTADPALKTPTNCMLRGCSGHLFARLRGSHLAAHADRSLRAEVDAVRHRARRPRGALDHAGDGRLQFPADRRQRRSARVMPAVGLEYRYPFIGVQPWGTQTIEPIAQLIVRPNEPRSASCRTRTRRA